MVILLLMACSGDLSNQVFVEDAAFRAALPQPEELALAWPEGATVPDEPPALLGLALEGLGDTVEWGERFLEATTYVSYTAPSERAEHYRVWGPVPWDEVPGWFVRAELSRTSDESLYGIGVSASDTTEGPWVEFLTGTFTPEPVEGSPWRGEASWRVGELSEGIEEDDGLVVLRYGADEARLLSLSFNPDAGSPSAYEIAQAEDLSGEVLLTTQDDFFGDGDGREERLVSLAQWDATGAGRGDARVSGGSLGLLQVDLHQCWGSDGVLVWQGGYEDDAWWPHVGDEADCPADLPPADLDAL